MGERLQEMLSTEVDLIENDDPLKKFINTVLGLVDDRYCEMPSSTSGRNHPPDERGEGGQVLHVKRVVYLITLFCEMLDVNIEIRNLLIAAGILHDIEKFTDDYQHTDPYHALKPRRLFNKIIDIEIDHEKIETILDLIEGHMGKWSASPKLVPRIEENGTIGIEWIVHFADNIATKYWGEF